MKQQKEETKDLDQSKEEVKEKRSFEFFEMEDDEWADPPGCWQV